MEPNKKTRKNKAIAPVLVALSVIAIAAILVYKNQDEVSDLGKSLLKKGNDVVKKGNAVAKKGLKKSSFLKDQFGELIDSLESRIRKAVA